MIEDRTVSAIVPYGQGKELIADLNSVDEIGNLGDFLRKAQLYSVNLYGYQRDLLERKVDREFPRWQGSRSNQVPTVQSLG